MHEGIPILNFLVPKAFIHENGQLTGMTVREGRRPSTTTRAAASWCRPASRTSIIDCDDVLVAIGQENAFPWIERDIGIEFDKWDMPKVDQTTLQSTNPKVFFGGDAAFGPKNIIWAVAHGHEAAISIDKLLQRRGRHRPAAAGGRRSISQKMGIHEWSYDNDISLDKRYQGAAARQEGGAARHQGGGRTRLRHRDSRLQEAQRCLNCDVQTVFTAKLCIECDACVDICPMDCITFTDERRGSRSAHAAEGAGGQPDPGPLCRRRSEDRPRHGEGRGRLPALRAVRRALPDRRLGHAEVSARNDSRG